MVKQAQRKMNEHSPSRESNKFSCDSKTLCIVGLGGVGSWLAAFLSPVKSEFSDIYVVDGDTVEDKNLLYANFEAKDVKKNKAKAIAKRYGFKPITRFIESPQDLKEFSMDTLYAICVDDITTRALIYRSAINWLDCRAEGKRYQVFTPLSKTVEQFMSAKEPWKRGSCQRDPYKRIDFGHVQAAAVAAQLILDYVRGELKVDERFG